MISIVFIISGALCAIYYLIGLYNETYWEKRGVKFYKSNKVFGLMGEFAFSKSSLFEIFNKIYHMYPNEPAVGVGSMLSPALYVKDPVNVQQVLNVDFNSFSHRGFEINKGDQLADNVLFMNGDRWKLIRQNMTPLFTSTKLKSMYYILDRSARDFVTYLNERPELLKKNAYHTLTTFSNASIGAAVFGIGNESIFDSPFLEMAMDTSRSNLIRDIKFALGSLNHTLFKLFRIKFFKQHEEFFIKAIKQVLRKREQENVKKHDFADLAISLKNKGLLKEQTTGLEIIPTDEVLAAQGFFFFIAGLNPEPLKRLHEEIDNTFEKYNDQMTYDIIQEMEYLDMVYNEALRKYTPVGYLTRQCIKDTVLPTGNIKIEKGTKIFTPIFEVHRDPKIFPDPEDFKPERFSRENEQDLVKKMFMPFGEGKRSCIGVRFASIQVKTGLVYFLRNFTVKTHVMEGGIKYSKQNTQVRPINVDVEFIPRNLRQKY